MLAPTLLVAVVMPSLATGSSSPAGKTETIQTIMQTTAFTQVAPDHDGKAKVGDYTVAQVVHLDPTTGRQIGTGVAICTQITADGSLFDCQGSDVLPGGELREAGRFTPGKTWHLSILGGSGRFNGASGSVDGAWLNPQLTRSHDVFTIKLA
jgi:hypothetical protein